MSGFPELIPAFTVQINLSPSLSLGTVSTGASVAIAPFLPGGSLTSEPNYPIKVEAAFEHGSDYLRIDPSKTHARIDVNGTLKDLSGAVLRMTYTGVMKLSPAILKVLMKSPEAKTTDFGDALTHVYFEVGSDALRDLETKVYVGCGHFVVDESGKPLVEYKISEVMYRTIPASL